MWLFTIYGFYSASAKGDVIEIRARLREHIVNLKKRFPEEIGGTKARILITEARDYCYRIQVSRETFAKIVYYLAWEQTRSNFKDAAQTATLKRGESNAYVSALHEIWFTMLRLQRKGLGWEDEDWSKL